MRNPIQTLVVVGAVYGIFSAACVLMISLLPPLAGASSSSLRSVFLLVKCGLSTCALLAIERWRLWHVSRSGSSSGGSGARDASGGTEGVAAADSSCGGKCGASKCGSGPRATQIQDMAPHAPATQAGNSVCKPPAMEPTGTRSTSGSNGGACAAADGTLGEALVAWDSGCRVSSTSGADGSGSCRHAVIRTTAPSPVTAAALESSSGAAGGTATCLLPAPGRLEDSGGGGCGCAPVGGAALLGAQGPAEAAGDILAPTAEALAGRGQQPQRQPENPQRVTRHDGQYPIRRQSLQADEQRQETRQQGSYGQKPKDQRRQQPGHHRPAPVGSLQPVEVATWRLCRPTRGAADGGESWDGNGAVTTLSRLDVARRRLLLEQKLRAAFQQCVGSVPRAGMAQQQTSLKLEQPRQEQHQPGVLPHLVMRPLPSVCLPSGLSLAPVLRCRRVVAAAQEAVPIRHSHNLGQAAETQWRESGTHVTYTCRTVLYGTRVKIDGLEPEHVTAGYQARIAQVVAQAGIQLEGVTVRRGCIELLIETRAVEGAPPSGSEAHPGPAAAAGLAYPAGDAGGEHASGGGADMAAGTGPRASGASGGGRASSQLVAAAPVAVAEAMAATTSPRERASSGRPDAEFEIGVTDVGGGRWEVTTLGSSSQRPGLVDDILDIGALIRALQLPESCSLESDLAPASEDGSETAEISGADRGGAAVSTSALPAFEYNSFAVGSTRAVAVSAAALAAGSAESPMASGPVGGVFPRTGTSEAPTWWDSSKTSTADSGASGAAATATADQRADTRRSRTSAGSSVPRTAGETGSPKSARQLLCPYVLDVYPRVLDVSTVPRVVGMVSASSQRELQATAAVAAAAVSAPQSAILVMVISWVPLAMDSPSRQGTSDAPAPAASSDWRAPATGADPWVDMVVAPCGAVLAAAGEDSRPTHTGALQAAEGAVQAATASEAESAAGPSSVSLAGGRTDGAAEAGLPRPGAIAEAAVAQDWPSASAPIPGGAFVLLRTHGEVVAVAFVAHSANAAAAAAAAAMSAAGATGQGGAAAPSSLTGGFAAAAGAPGDAATATADSAVTRLDVGDCDREVSRSQRRSSTNSEAADAASVSATAAYARASGGSGGDQLADQQTAAAATAGGGAAAGSGGGATALGCEALYSLEMGPLLGQLRPGVLLVEAHAGPESPADAMRHGSSAVPVLMVDDPRVAQELQAALDNWHGTVDELDNVLCDIGALVRMQDELRALAATVAGGGGAGGNNVILQLSSMSARTELLYNHLASYADAMCWVGARQWLLARQQAAGAALAAAMVVAAAQPPPPPAASGRLQATVAVGSVPMLASSALGGSEAPAAALAQPAAPPVTKPAAPAAAAPPLPPCSHGSEPRSDTIDTSGGGARGAAGAGGRSLAWRFRLPFGPSFRGLVPALRGLLRLLGAVLGWLKEDPSDAAAYAAYTSSFAASMMNVMQVMDLIGFLTVMIRAAQWSMDRYGGGGGGRTALLDSDKACVLMAASTGVVMGALWLVLPRDTWRRLSARAKWPRQVSYTMSKAMVAFMGFPQPPTTLRHELGPSIFVVEGVILPAAVLMSPAESVLMGLVRAPLCARMWLLAEAGYTPLFAMLRALALSAANVVTTVVVHMYIRVSYERRKRAAAQRSKQSPKQE